MILTTSDAEEDVLRSYDLHANAYVAKPVGFESFVSVVRQIDEFFLTIVRLPRDSAPFGPTGWTGLTGPRVTRE